MKIKKILVCFTVCLAILFLYGCGNRNSENNQLTKIDKKYIENEVTATATATAVAAEPTKSSKTTKTETKAPKKAQKKAPVTVTPPAARTSTKKSTDKPKKKTKIKQDKTSKKKNTNKNTISPKPSSTPVATQSQEDTSEKDYCYISIDCKTILSNMDKLEPSKKSFVPKNGQILSRTKVEIDEKDSAYDILYRICRKHDISIESEYTPAYGTYYIEGINQLYEFDCGDLSGWNYFVNGKSPNFGCSGYMVKKGDELSFRYTCNAGKDLQ